MKRSLAIALVLLGAGCTEAGNVTMRLEQHKAAPIDGATWQQVETALETLDPAGNGFVILDGHGADYIQTAGSVASLMVEYRKYTDSSGCSFRHYVLAHPGGGKTATQIEAYSGSFTVQESEVLMLADAKRAFRTFFETGDIPESYELHDISGKFKQRCR